MNEAQLTREQDEKQQLRKNIKEVEKDLAERVSAPNNGDTLKYVNTYTRIASTENFCHACTFDLVGPFRKDAVRRDHTCKFWQWLNDSVLTSGL